MFPAVAAVERISSRSVDSEFSAYEALQEARHNWSVHRQKMAEAGMALFAKEGAEDSDWARFSEEGHAASERTSMELLM